MAIGKQVAEAYIEVNGDLSPFRRDLERARLAVARANKAMEKDSDGTWKRIGDSAKRALQKIEKSWSRMDRTVRLVVTLIAAAGDQMATLGSGLAASGAALISTFGMALANLIPLVATLPGLAYGIGLAVSAIGRMKDAGGAAAQAIASIGKAYQNAAVPAFTKEWEDSVTRFSKTLSKTLSDTSVPTALGKAFADMTDSFTAALESPSFAAFEEAMSTTLAAAIGNLGSGVANLTKGFMELFAAAGPAAERLTNSFRQWGNAWADSMSRMRQDGTLQRVFDAAYTSGAALMNLSGALGHALGSVFMIGAKYGDDLVNSLAAVTNQFTAWSKTAEGQTAINQWFANGVRILKAMEPMVVGLGRAMAILVTDKSIKQWEGINESMGRFLPMMAEVLRVIGSLDLLGSLVALLDGLATGLAVMAGPLDQIATILGGVLRSAVDAISQAFIGMGVALTGPLQAAVPGIQAIATILTSAFAPMAEIFVTIVRLIATALTPAIQVVSSALVSLTPGLSQIVALFDNGLKGALTAIEPAFVSIGNLLGVVAIAFGQLVTALMPTVALLSAAFTGALTTLMPHIVGLVETVTSGLIPIFLEIGGALGVLGPRFADLTGQLMNFVNQGLALVGPFLSSLGGMFQQMLPFLTMLGNSFMAMLPSVMAVADVLGKLFVTALAALIPMIASILPLVLSMVETFMTFAVGVAPIVANLFANIINAIIPLIPVVTGLITQFASLAEMLLGRLLPAVLPILEQFGTVFAGALMTLMPYITDFAARIGELAMLFLTQLLPALIPIITTLAGGLLTIIMQLVPHFYTIVTVVGELAIMFLTQLLPALMPLVAAITSMASLIVSMLIPAFQILGVIIQAVMPIIQFIIEGVINNIIGVIQGLTRVIQGIADFFNAIFRGDIAGAWDALVNIVLGAVEAIWNFVQLTFIGKLIGGLKAGITAIVGFFKSGWDNVVGGVSSAWGGIINFITGAMNKIMSFIGSGIGAIGNFFRTGWSAITSFVSSAWSNLINGAVSGIGNIVSFVGSLPGKIGSALSGLPGQLLGIAKNMMQGFINGVVGMAGNIFNAAVNAVKGAIDGVKNFLGIRSPSRLAKGLGEYTGEGFALGLDALKGRVKSAAEKMAESATGAFDRSAMFIAGQDAGAALASGLIASKSEIAGALSSMSKSMTVSAAAIGSGPIGSSGSATTVPAAGEGRSITLAEGAIQIVTPTKDPEIVASKVVDELTNFSML